MTPKYNFTLGAVSLKLIPTILCGSAGSRLWPVSSGSHPTPFTEIELTSDTVAQVHDNSIDYAVMEKSDNVAVVSCSLGWSDIGSWTVIDDLAQRDGKGLRIEVKPNAGRSL